LRSSAKEFRMACGELFLYAWHCYWMLTVDRSAGPFAGLRSTIVGQRKNKATIHPMLNLPKIPFPRRVAASFNQSSQATAAMPLAFDRCR
jgi:hypothetical protein